jgi:hypothetical protein
MSCAPFNFRNNAPVLLGAGARVAPSKQLADDP